ncbi:MAG: response regulator [Myxococcota bacterium]
MIPGEDTTHTQAITVLVVEDEAEHQLLVRKALTREGSGFELVQFARDSEEALRFANQMSFDVMLVDNRIPGTRGLDLLTALREVGSEAPFVLMTSAGSEDLVVEAWRQKVAEYVIKDSGFWRDLPQVLRRVVAADRARRREQDLVARLERTNARLDQLRTETDERSSKLEALLGEARAAFGELAPTVADKHGPLSRLDQALGEMAALFE